MGKITTVGIDLAKNVFSVHAVDERGAVLLRKTVSRARLLPLITQWPACLIGMEACLGHITKRGDPYLRTLLILGARSALQVAARRSDKLSRWAMALKERRGYHRAVVALAAKNARIIWAILAGGSQYRSA